MTRTDRTTFRHVAPVLDQVLRGNRLAQGVADYAIFARWAEIIGRPLHEWTKPLRVSDGTLWVLVDNSTLLHHLGYVAPQMCNRLREAAPETSIRRVRFTLKELE